jgi:methionyl-tRNA formyltransferase
MLVQLLVDNPNSWIIPFTIKLKEKIEKQFSFSVSIISNHEDVIEGDFLFLLSCEKIFNKLKLNNYNLVIHESQLPKGKGWSPLTWQVLEGENKIPITLFEATDKVDAGKVYFRDFINLNGDELLSEIKQKQGEKTIDLILKFLSNYKNFQGEIQKGESTYYARRNYKDSELNINDSIKNQFNLLRVCDNERYPAFFILNGEKYILKIESHKR